MSERHLGGLTFRLIFCLPATPVHVRARCSTQGIGYKTSNSLFSVSVTLCNQHSVDEFDDGSADWCMNRECIEATKSNHTSFVPYELNMPLVSYDCSRYLNGLEVGICGSSRFQIAARELRVPLKHIPLIARLMFFRSASLCWSTDDFVNLIPKRYGEVNVVQQGHWGRPHDSFLFKIGQSNHVPIAKKVCNLAPYYQCVNKPSNRTQW